MCSGRRQGSGETEDRFVLGFERLFDVIVEFPIGSGSLRCVQVASTFDVAVGCVEIERACDIFKLGKRKKLMEEKLS